MSRKIVRHNSTLMRPQYVTKMLYLFYKCITLQKAIESAYDMCYILVTGCNIRLISKEMRKEEENMLKNNKGITLIALVVSIIVLLILARSWYKYVNRAKW